MHRSRPLIPALAVLALLVVACGSGDPTPSEPVEPSVAAEPSEAAEDDFTVTLNGFAFSTGQLVVPVGTEVTFENEDTAAHTVTEGSGGQAADDPIILNAQVGPGGVARFTFDEPGTYAITCLLHSTMNMTVVVEG